MRFLRLLGLIVLAIPLLGGSCSFSSSNGDTTVVVRTGDCVETPDDPSPCTPDPDPDPDGTAVVLELPPSPPRVAIEPVATPAVPALGGVARAILAGLCVATVASRLPLRRK